jgi:Membrane proteins related to metalloendopeptidases
MDAQIAAIQEEMERQRQAAIEAARQAEAQQQTVDASVEAYANAPVYSGGGLVWPMPAGYEISSGFGARWGSFHRGIDIPCNEGSTVIAACGGIVSFVGVYHWSTGNSVLIDCGNGMTNMYYHLSGYNCSVGQVVNAGDPIAFSGNTGNSTGPHLHFGVMINGEYYDPLGFF